MLYPDKYKEELEYSTLGRTIHYDPTVLQVTEGKVVGCVTECLCQKIGILLRIQIAIRSLFGTQTANAFSQRGVKTC